jgi:hypothetical protein
MVGLAQRLPGVGEIVALLVRHGIITTGGVHGVLHGQPAIGGGPQQLIGVGLHQVLADVQPQAP